MTAAHATALGGEARRLDLGRAIYAPGGEPLDYPSRIVEGPLLVSGDRALPLRAADGFGRFLTPDGTDLDALLRERGAAALAERVPQVAFGAHRNPENIAYKLAAYAAEHPGLPRDLVMLPGWIQNADVVACNVSSGGHMYSGLLTTRPELRLRRYLLGTRCPVTILLLDHAQMTAMHEMAGIAKPGGPEPSLRCDLADIPVDLGGGATILAQTYGVAVPFLGLHGRPLAFEAVATSGRTCPALSQAGMFRAINGVIAAEEERPGATPIIDTIASRRRELAAAGDAKRIVHDPLFARVKETLASRHILHDEDGKARFGLDGIWEARRGEDAWRVAPLFRPDRASAPKPGRL